jgi:hypothetical protein
MKLLAVLPTGDWSEITDVAKLYFYEIEEEAFHEFHETGEEDWTLAKCTGVYSPSAGYRAVQTETRSDS